MEETILRETYFYVVLWILGTVFVCTEQIENKAFKKTVKLEEKWTQTIQVFSLGFTCVVPSEILKCWCISDYIYPMAWGVQFIWSNRSLLAHCIVLLISFVTLFFFHSLLTNWKLISFWVRWLFLCCLAKCFIWYLILKNSLCWFVFTV